MANFSKAIEVILRHEGGYADAPNDRGGPTKYGISLKFIREELGHGDATADDVKAIFRGQAEAIYYQYFWRRYRINEIIDDTVATKVLDLFVNLRPSAAAKIVQKALCALGADVEVDGVVGSKTLVAVNGADSVQLVQKIIGLQSDHYREIVQHNPTQACFLTGWLERATWPLGTKGTAA